MSIRPRIVRGSGETLRMAVAGCGETLRMAVRWFCETLRMARGSSCEPPPWKTAIVEGLARKIVIGDVPDPRGIPARVTV